VVVSARDMQPERLNNLQTLCSDRGVRLSRLRIGLESLIESEAGINPARIAKTSKLHQIKG
jgi:hypothetical protein